jgi:PGF-CTERM protein
MGLAELIFGICRTRSQLELYDVNYGGIERMTKRLTIALVALAMFMLVMVMPVSAFASVPAGHYHVAQNIGVGATVFIGEENLDISNVAPDGTNIGYWASAANRVGTPASKTVRITGASAYTVTYSDYGIGGSIADWYYVAANGDGGALAFRVADPTLDVNIWDATISADVTGKSVPKGELLRFGIVTNQYAALVTNRTPIYNNSTGDGYLDLKVKTESGAVLTSLYTNTLATSWARLMSINVTTQPYTWGQTAGLDLASGGAAAVPLFNWTTDAAIGGQPAYAPGTYTVWVESGLNNMKSKYKDASGADYTGKTISPVRTVTLVSDTVKITANKDSVVRSKPFSVTIVGKPSATYCVWVKGSKTLGDSLDNQPPMITPFQAGVTADNGTYCADYSAQNIGTIFGDTYNAGASAANNMRRFAAVLMTTSGTRTVQFDTNNLTKAQKYTIRVEQNFSGQIRSDQVDVKVEKGAVTIVAAGDQSYYLGEEVKFSGTNTESFTTHLFIIGPNLATNGARLIAPRSAVINMDDTTFVKADVAADNTWSYKWGTATVPLDAGTYTVYAVSQPVDRESTHISAAAYGTVSIIIKKPFVSATASQSTVAKGDRIYITGTAEGQPSAGVAIWVMGKNYASYNTETVNADSSFKFEIKQDDTKTLTSGQYFIVVQHPMQNNEFDIDLGIPSASTCTPVPALSGRLGGSCPIVVMNEMLTGTGAQIFLINGPGSLQGSDAAEALVQGINDPNVDDTYTKLQFLVEEGLITIDPVGDRHVGDKFTITAQTNLAVDDEILVQVYSSSFKPTQKSQSGEFSGATGTVKVTKGDSGMNKISFDVDASTFKPDEYIVTEEAVIQGTTGTSLFNVLEGAAPTAKPTVVVTTVVPTTVATPVPTTVPPTPTPTKSPGYGALIALIGLGAVAFIVVRRH